MNFEPEYFGNQATSLEDRQYAGSRFSEVRTALFANAYYLTWGGPDEPPLPVFGVSLYDVLAGSFRCGGSWLFRDAAARTIQSKADMRWGPNRRGFRRIVHPNGVCLLGKWEIDDAPDGDSYTGYFKKGSQALIVARYSTCCTETRRRRNRSRSLAGKLFPTNNSEHPAPLRTANFFTQEDLGGSNTPFINDVELRNAPDITPWRRGAGLPVFLVTAAVFLATDKDISVRQLYPIAELGEPEGAQTKSPVFMRLLVDKDQPRVQNDDLDFRDEILAHIYDKDDPEPKRTLTFNIEVADDGTRSGLIIRRWTINNWKKIGRITFTEAVASYNGDFVIHFPHPPWRIDRNDPLSVAHVIRSLSR
jgi:hypothetical protein